MKSPIPTGALTKMLGVGRIVAGGMAWATPKLASDQFGMPKAAAEPEAHVLGQLFGSRDIVLGTALLIAPDARMRTAVLRAGLIIDSMDLVAALRAKSALSTKAMLAVGGGAASAIVAGLLMLADES